MALIGESEVLGVRVDVDCVESFNPDGILANLTHGVLIRGNFMTERFDELIAMVGDKRSSISRKTVHMSIASLAV